MQPHERQLEDRQLFSYTHTKITPHEYAVEYSALCISKLAAIVQRLILQENTYSNE